MLRSLRSKCGRSWNPGLISGFRPCVMEIAHYRIWTFAIAGCKYRVIFDASPGPAGWRVKTIVRVKSSGIHIWRLENRLCWMISISWQRCSESFTSHFEAVLRSFEGRSLSATVSTFWDPNIGAIVCTGISGAISLLSGHSWRTKKKSAPSLVWYSPEDAAFRCGLGDKKVTQHPHQSD